MSQKTTSSVPTPRPETSVTDRRTFLRNSLGMASALTLPACLVGGGSRKFPPAKNPDRVVLVRFGGGVRHQDLFGSEDTCLAPFLRFTAGNGVLVSDVWNENHTRHDTGTLYLLTGRYGSPWNPDTPDDGAENARELSQAPTIFELYRAQRDLPASATLAVGLPAASLATSFGPDVGALCFDPVTPLTNTRSISGDPSLLPSAHVEIANQRLGQLAGNLDESSLPFSHSKRAAEISRFLKEQDTNTNLLYPELEGVLNSALAERVLNKKPYVSTEEVDDWTLNLALRAMTENRPTLTGIGFATPDIAHTGSWDSYANQVRRIDMLLNRLMNYVHTDPFYRERTLVLVTADCGRGSERFDQHLLPREDPDLHRVFLVAAGTQDGAERLVSDTRSQIDVAATVATVLGLDIPDSSATPIEEAIS